MLGVFTLALFGVGVVTGQVPFGGFGGFGGGGQSDPINLVRNKQVQKELDITDEQLEKLPDAIHKALGEVLNAKQHARLRQIELQLRGTNALSDAKVQSDLKLTGEQKESVKTILEDSRRQIAELFKGGGGKGFGGGGGEKAAAMRKETQEKLEGVLTADQRRAWRDMLGDEFKLETKGFGGFGGKKGFKKKDNEIQ
jgi:hypothetical protein